MKSNLLEFPSGKNISASISTSNYIPPSYNHDRLPTEVYNMRLKDIKVYIDCNNMYADRQKFLDTIYEFDPFQEQAPIYIINQFVRNFVDNVIKDYYDSFVDINIAELRNNISIEDLKSCLQTHKNI